MLPNLRRVLPYYRPYRTALILGLVLVAVAQGFSILLPWLLKMAIDALADSATTVGDVGLFSAALVLAALLGGLARFGMRELLNGISRKIEVDLRDDFFAHILKLDASFFQETRTGDLMSRSTNDILAVRQATGPALMYAVNTGVGFVMALVLMLTISVRMTLLALVPLVLLPPAVLWFGKVIHRRFEEIQEHYSTLSTMVQENLTGLRIVRAYTQERDQERRFDELNHEYRQRNMRLAIASGAFYPIMSFMAGLGMVVVLWVGGLQVIDGAITVGDYVAFFFYLTLLVWPMIALGWVTNLFQRGEASMGRILKIMEREPKVLAPAEGAEVAEVRGRVEFEGVGFRYPGTERWVLRDITFTAEPGTTTAIVGATGSGKSTLVSLTPRIYDPDEGVVRVDGIPVPEWDPRTLREATGMVPQDTFLFSDTLRTNIALGLGPTEVLDEAGDDPRVEAASRVAQLHETITDFPKAYETLLGERGINLSGGPKQRATLARAVARDPRILILDDALSAVDTQTEARILADLRGVMAERTSFLISHRISAVMDADQILVIDDGRIVERGTHDQLVAESGIYAGLLRRQTLEEAVRDAPEATPA